MVQLVNNMNIVPIMNMVTTANLAATSMAHHNHAARMREEDEKRKEYSKREYEMIHNKNIEETYVPKHAKKEDLKNEIEILSI